MDMVHDNKNKTTSINVVITKMYLNPRARNPTWSVPKCRVPELTGDLHTHTCRQRGGYASRS